jgi:hypothetical protein
MWKVNGRQTTEAKWWQKNRRPESIIGGDEKEKQLAEKDAEVRVIKQIHLQYLPWKRPNLYKAKQKLCTKDTNNQFSFLAHLAKDNVKNLP